MHVIAEHLMYSQQHAYGISTVIIQFLLVGAWTTTIVFSWAERFSPWFAFETEESRAMTLTVKGDGLEVAKDTGNNVSECDISRSFQLCVLYLCPS